VRAALADLSVGRNASGKAGSMSDYQIVGPFQSHRVIVDGRFKLTHYRTVGSGVACYPSLAMRPGRGSERLICILACDAVVRVAWPAGWALFAE
jgi:hypothetical protein